MFHYLKTRYSSNTEQHNLKLNLYRDSEYNLLIKFKRQLAKKKEKKGVSLGNLIPHADITYIETE